jgi:hypothetical protein
MWRRVLLTAMPLSLKNVWNTSSSTCGAHHDRANTPHCTAHLQQSAASSCNTSAVSAGLR